MNEISHRDPRATRNIECNIDRSDLFRRIGATTIVPQQALVIGDDTRSFLAIVRSLGRAGTIVDAAPFDFSSPALKSRYIHNVRRLPLIIENIDIWRGEFSQLLAREKYDVVIPCDERSLLPLHILRGSIPRDTVLAIPSPEQVSVLFDKQRTRELAQQCGVPVARGRVFETTASLAEVAGEFPPPCVIKPLASYDMGTLYQRNDVQIIESREQLRTALGKISTGFLVEELFPGRGVGVSVLAHQGTLLRAFQHQRIRTTTRVGGSSYRKSVPLTADLKGACARMISALNMTGLVNFEFIVGETPDDWIIVEANARPWGSLPLALNAGVDFPRQWMRTLSGAPPHADFSYKTNRYARSAINDFYALVGRFRAPDGHIIQPFGLVLSMVREFMLCVLRRESIDSFARDDLCPGWLELGGFLRDRMSALLKRLRFVRMFLRVHGRARLRVFLRRLAAERKLDPSVCFVCQGNINRSPFAKGLLERLARDRGLTLHVLSAGILPRADCVAPEPAQRAAQSHGVSLKSHRSAYFDEYMAATSDLVVVFDETIEHAIKARYPELVEKMFMLGNLLHDKGAIREIEDPDGKSDQVYNIVYAQIAAAVEEFTRMFASN